MKNIGYILCAIAGGLAILNEGSVANLAAVLISVIGTAITLVG